MKLLTSTVVALSLSLGYVNILSAQEKETKKVCIDQKDKEGNVIKDKNGKAKQTCKDVKVHKKLEGTEVPGQKK